MRSINILKIKCTCVTVSKKFGQFNVRRTFAFGDRARFAAQKLCLRSVVVEPCLDRDNINSCCLMFDTAFSGVDTEQLHFFAPMVGTDQVTGGSPLIRSDLQDFLRFYLRDQALPVFRAARENQLLVNSKFGEEPSILLSFLKPHAAHILYNAFYSQCDSRHSFQIACGI